MPITSSTIPSSAWRQPLWLGLLIVASVAFSLGFSCATPFAAFGAAAALTMARRRALLLSAGVWLANQIVGFGVLYYPWTANTLAWGFFIGVAAILGTLAAREVALRLRAISPGVANGAAFIAAFAVYEATLLAVAALLLGDVEAFRPAIVGQILVVNLAAFLGLLAINRLGVAIGLADIAPRFSPT